MYMSCLVYSLQCWSIAKAGSALQVSLKEGLFNNANVIYRYRNYSLAVKTELHGLKSS